MTSIYTKIYYKVRNIENDDIYYFSTDDNLTYKISFFRDSNSSIPDSVTLYLSNNGNNFIPVHSKRFKNETEAITFNAELFANEYIRTLETYTLNPVGLV